MVLYAMLNSDRRKAASPRVHGPQQGNAWTRRCLAGNGHMWAVGPRRTRGKMRHTKILCASDRKPSRFGLRASADDGIYRACSFTADQPALASTSIKRLIGGNKFGGQSERDGEWMATFERECSASCLATGSKGATWARCCGSSAESLRASRNS